MANTVSQTTKVKIRQAPKVKVAVKTDGTLQATPPITLKNIIGEGRTLTEMADVNIVNPSNDQILAYVSNTNSWNNRAAPTLTGNTMQFVVSNTTTFDYNVALSNTVTIAGALIVGNGFSTNSSYTYVANAQITYANIGAAYIANAVIVGGTSLVRDIIPDANNLYTIGNNTNRFATLYLSGDTLYMGNVVFEDTGTNLHINDPSGNPMSLSIGNTSITGDLNVTQGFSANSLVANTLQINKTATIAANAAVGNNVLFVDTVTNRIGVGTATPAATLDVQGNTNILSDVLIGGNTTVYGTTTLANVAAVQSDSSIVGATYTSKTFSIAAQDGSSTGLFFSSNGAFMYVVGQSGDAVQQYTLSTPWDIATAVYTQNFSVLAQDTASTDLFFSPDGLKMYVAGDTVNGVLEYTLGTAWNVTTATYTQQFSVNTQETAIAGMYFKPDGTKMYICGSTSDTVFQYTLATPWNTSTATYDSKSFSIATQEGSSAALWITNDGVTMYVMGSATDSIFQYTLATPWDVSTATYTGNNVFVGHVEQGPLEFFFNESLGKLWVGGTTSDAIREFTTTPAAKVNANTLILNASVTRVGNTLVVANAIYGMQTLTVYGTTVLGSSVTSGTITIGNTVLGGTTISTGNSVQNSFLSNVLAAVSLGVPGTPTTATATTGGTLAAATYYYRITAIDANGNESLGSTEVSRATTGTTSTVTLTFAPVLGAFSYRVYRSTTTGVYTAGYIAVPISSLVVSGANYAYTDTGTTLTVATLPTTTNARLFYANNTANAVSYFGPITIKAQSNVGILTIAPDAVLTVGGAGTANIGGNTTIGGSTGSAWLQVGNTTVNTFANSSLVKVANSTAIANLSPIGLVVGTTVANATVLATGANVQLTTTQLSIGNTTVNAVVNATSVVLSGATGSIQTSALYANSQIQVTDAASGTMLRLLGSGTSTYIQAGSNSTNTTAELVLARTLTTSSTIANVKVFAINTMFAGGNVGITAGAASVIPDATLSVTGTANVSGNVYTGGQLSVGANVIANTTAVFVGNSTVNSVITSSTLAVTGNGYFSNRLGVGAQPIANVKAVFDGSGQAGIVVNKQSTYAITNANVVGGATAKFIVSPYSSTTNGYISVSSIHSPASNGFTAYDSRWYLTSNSQGSYQGGMSWVIDSNNDGVEDLNYRIFEYSDTKFEIFTANNSRVFVASNGNVGIATSTPGSLLTVSGTATLGNTTVSGTASLGNTTITGFANVTGNLQISDTLSGNNLTLTGNLTVSGTTTYINTTTLNVGDNIITLNADLSAVTPPTENVGIEVNRGNAANVQFIWDETNDYWSFGNTYINGTAVVTSNTYLGGAVNSESLRVVAQAGANRPIQIQGGVAGSLGARIGVASEALDYYTSGGYSHFFATNGPRSATQFEIAHTSSAVNWIRATGSTTGNAPAFLAQGADTDVNIIYQTKGVGNHQFRNGAGAYLFQINTQTTVANYGVFTATAAGTSPLLQVAGSDTNIDFRFRTQGTGAYQFDTGTNTNTQFKITNTASAVNYIQAAGSATGTGPTLSAQGSDVDTSFNIASKGTGVVAFYTRGALQAYVTGQTSAVNYVVIGGQTTGNYPSVAASGSDTNVGLDLISKAAGPIRARTGGGEQFRVVDTANAVNYVQVTGGGTPMISAQGSDQYVTLSINAKAAPIILSSRSTGRSLMVADTGQPGANYLQIAGYAAGSSPVLSAQGSDTNVDVIVSAKGTGVTSSTSPVQIEADTVVTTKTLTTTTTTASQVIATFDGTIYRSAEFIIQATDTTGTKYQKTKMLAVHNGTTAEYVEFGNVNVGGDCGAFDVSYSTGIQLRVTPASTNSTVFKVTCILTKV